MLNKTMPKPLKPRNYLLKILQAFLLFIFLLQSGLGMLQESSTWDETHYFGLGKYLINNMKWDVPGTILHPPLSFYISSIPMMFVSSDNKEIWQYNDKPNIEFLGEADNHRGQTLLSSALNKNNRLLNSSRAMIILISLLSGLYIYLWSNAIYGKKGALLSLFFFAFSPNLLAHSHLATPDMVLTTFFFIAVFYYWKNLETQKRKHAVTGGFFLGLALMSKFTGVLLFPLLLVILCIYRFKGEKINFIDNTLYIGTGLFILLLGYGFDITPYIQGITFQLQHANSGHSSFLMGEHSSSGWWYYYIIAFLIKTPIPTLILLFTVLLFTAVKFNPKSYASEYSLIVPIIFILLFFSVMHQSIGLRYILPVYPFIFVLTGKITQVKTVKKREKLALLLVMLWYISGTLGMNNHYLAYFNEFVHGPENGYKYLVDSNLDWGQDLPGLKKYMEKNEIKHIYLSYYGTDLPERYGINYTWMPSPLYAESPGEDGLRIPLEGFLAVSATNLQGLYFNNNELYAWLKNCNPIAKIGYSIFIYDMKHVF